jgi:hypothetical protein
MVILLAENSSPICSNLNVAKSDNKNALMLFLEIKIEIWIRLKQVIYLMDISAAQN